MNIPKESRTRFGHGQLAYPDWLRTLTPEERAEHLEQRRQRREAKKITKSLKETMDVVIKQYEAEWAASLHAAAVSLVQKAIATGDAQAFTAVWDRMVGKPDSKVDVTSNGTHIDPASEQLSKIDDDEMVKILTGSLRSDDQEDNSKEK